MQFKVSGINRETGARMSLQCEAGSKAGAERKATQAGMEVHRCELAIEGALPAAAASTERHSHGELLPESTGNIKRLITLLIVVIVIAAVLYYALPAVRGLLHR